MFRQQGAIIKTYVCRFLGEHHDVLEIDKPLIKIYIKHNCFCYYLLYARPHVSTYLSGHHQAFL